MIDFACKEFRIEEIVKCSMSLTKAEYLVMKHLISNKDDGITTNEIAKSLNLDLSTVQRAVKKLHDQQLLLKAQQNLQNGGYVYNYSSVAEEEIRTKVLERVHMWVKKVEQGLNTWP